MSESPLRILVVDDSALYRQLVRNVLREIEGVEVVGIAKTGREALDLTEQLDPDLLTLDVRMPDLDGMDVLREFKKGRRRARAIMLSSLTANGAQVTTDALFEGAFDFIHKPSGSNAEQNRLQLLTQLAEKIQTFRASPRPLSRTGGPSLIPSLSAPRPRPVVIVDAPAADKPDLSTAEPVGRFDVLVIGLSTGGPVALREFLPQLPGDFPVPILIVQHMPAIYTHSLAMRLNETSPLEVVEGVEGMPVDSGMVYIAPGGRHMKVERCGTRVLVRITDDPPENSCRPAVDYTFRSAAEVYHGRVLAAVLTGMGRDGTEGCREIKKRGGRVFTQHPDGCVVYGMPKAVVDEKLSDYSVPLERLAAMLLRQVRK